MRWLLLLLLILVGCSGSQASSEPAGHPAPRRAVRTTPKVSAVSALSVSGIEGSFGPYRAVSGAQALLLWAAANDDGSRSWFSLVTDARGQPRSQPRLLSHAPAQLGLVRVRAHARGFLALISAVGDDGPVLETLVLGDGGQLMGGALLTQPSGDVVWLDVFPLVDRTLVAWATMSGSGRADVFSATLNLQGALLSQPQVVARSVTAWQGLLIDDEVAIATVRPTVADRALGTVELSFVNQSGKVSPPLEVSKGSNAQADVDLARIGDKVLCAWSDVSQYRAQVRLSVVDSSGRITVEAKPVAVGVADQALVRLVSRPSAGHAYLLWENLTPNIGSPRDFGLSRIDVNANTLGRTLTVRYDADSGVPELEASDTGAMVVTQIGDCVSEPCDDVPLLSHYVRLSTDLGVLGSAPVAVSTPRAQAPDAVWGVECGEQCTALATLKQTPAPIYTVSLAATTQGQATLVSPLNVAARPRAAKVEVLVETEPLAKVTATPSARGPVLAWITDFDANSQDSTPRVAPDGQKRPMQAWLQTRVLNGDGTASAVETISYRARSLGGVTLAHDAKTQQTLLVWAALDQNKPHVFVTLLDATGKKLKQRMLTQSGGEVYDTAAVVVEDGFIVAWVDARSGTPRAYATKIDGQLTRRMPDIPLSSGVVSGLALDFSDNQLWVAYAESSDALTTETVFLAKLGNKDLAPVGMAIRLSSGRRHAHSPELSRARSGLQAVWLEDESQELDTATHVLSSRIEGAVASSPNELDLGEYSASSATVSCGENSCRVVAAAREGSQRAALLGGTLAGPGSNKAAALRVLAELDATGLLAAPALLDSAVFLGDVGRAGRGWVQRVEVNW
ncbi:MAG TPA: hypothetical protein VHO25_16330 [Polyangiaceae bacterium]|nr:hypothetical protein [Polyangiaceae bacterium]